MKIPILIAAPFLFLTPRAIACTTCDSVVAHAVRKKVFGSDFWPHIAFTLLPFAILLAVTAGIHHGL
jgi:hypothetical protein